MLPMRDANNKKSVMTSVLTISGINTGLFLELLLKEESA